jgi:hypothetical protein
MGGERRTDVRVLIPVEERPYLVDRAAASPLSGIAGDRYRLLGHFERMQAVFPAVPGIDVKPVLVLEAIIQRRAVVRFCHLAFSYHVNDPCR